MLGVIPPGAGTEVPALFRNKRGNFGGYVVVGEEMFQGANQLAEYVRKGGDLPFVEEGGTPRCGRYAV
jgi:hypothetical protein